MSPYIALGLAVGLVVTHGWAFKVGQDAQFASEQRRAEDVRQAGMRAAEAAASAIAAIEVQHVEITQPVVTKIRETVRYADCRHEPSVMRGINSALTGVSAGDGIMPAASATSR